MTNADPYLKKEIRCPQGQRGYPSARSQQQSEGKKLRKEENK